MKIYHSHAEKTTGGTPENRVLTAFQKMRLLAGRCDLSKYSQQIIMAVAYMEANRA